MHGEFSDLLSVASPNSVFYAQTTSPTTRTPTNLFFRSPKIVFFRGIPRIAREFPAVVREIPRNRRGIFRDFLRNSDFFSEISTFSSISSKFVEISSKFVEFLRNSSKSDEIRRNSSKFAEFRRNSSKIDGFRRNSAKSVVISPKSVETRRNPSNFVGIRRNPSNSVQTGRSVSVERSQSAQKCLRMCVSGRSGIAQHPQSAAHFDEISTNFVEFRRIASKSVEISSKFVEIGRISTKFVGLVGRIRRPPREPRFRATWRFLKTGGQGSPCMLCRVREVRHSARGRERVVGRCRGRHGWPSIRETSVQPMARLVVRTTQCWWQSNWPQRSQSEPVGRRSSGSVSWSTAGQRLMWLPFAATSSCQTDPVQRPSRPDQYIRKNRVRYVGSRRARRLMFSAVFSSAAMASSLL